MKRQPDLGTHFDERVTQLDDAEDAPRKGGGGGFNRIINMSHVHWTRWLIGFVAFVVFLSSWIYVSPDENAVIQRFGRHVRTEEPGLHFKAPWPVEESTTVSVTSIQRLELGYRTEKQGPPAEYKIVKDEAQMLTGDMNIIDIEWIKQFRRADAAKWLFSVKHPEKALQFLSQSSMRQVAGGTTFDDLATSGRAQVQDEDRKVSQQLTDALNLGAQFTLTQLQDVVPPENVKDAFRSVTNAKETQQKLVQEAEGYRNQRIPYARGEAAKIVQESEGYKQQRMDWARGDVARFLDVLAKYKQAPEITMQRLRLEGIESIMAGKDQLVDRSNEGPLKLYNTRNEGK